MPVSEDPSPLVPETVDINPSYDAAHPEVPDASDPGRTVRVAGANAAAKFISGDNTFELRNMGSGTIRLRASNDVDAIVSEYNATAAAEVAASAQRAQAAIAAGNTTVANASAEAALPSPRSIHVPASFSAKGIEVAGDLIHGGGLQWKMVSFDDFSLGAPGWSNETFTMCGSNDRFLGGYCKVCNAFC